MRLSFGGLIFYLVKIIDKKFCLLENSSYICQIKVENMTLKEFRGDFDLRPQEVASSVRYFFKNDIDWDVFLPTKGMNLQRGFVWTLEQKRELIYSVFMGRHVPHCAIINIVNPKDKVHMDKLNG